MIMEQSNGGKYQLKHKLGVGGFAATFIAKSGDSSEEDVIKMISLQNTSTENAERELLIHRELDHSHIIKLKDHYYEGNFVFLVLEYARGGDLFQVLKEHKRKQSNFTEKEIVKIGLEIISGLKYIHEKRIVHLDLKPANIFLTFNREVKIGDFGISKIIGDYEYIMASCGTLDYSAPEVLKREKFNYEPDIWSLGVILYELCTLRTPFQGLSPNDKLHAIFNLDCDRSKLKPYSMELQQLIKLMLKRERHKRIKTHAAYAALHALNIRQKLIMERLSSIPSSHTDTSSASVEEGLSSHLLPDQHLDILSRESLNLSEQDEVAFQELKRGGEIEEIKFQIFERLTCGKWISFCLLIYSVYQLYLYFFFLLPAGLPSKEEEAGYRMSDDVSNLYMGFLSYTFHIDRGDWITARLSINLSLAILQFIVGVLSYNYLSAFNLRKTKIAVVIIGSYLLIFLAIQTTFLVFVYKNLLATRNNHEKTIFWGFVLTLFIPVVFSLTIVIIAFSQIPKFEDIKARQIQIQITQQPLYIISDLIYGIGYLLLLFGILDFFFIICVILINKSSLIAYLIKLVTSGILRIISAILCFKYGRKRTTKKIKSFCTYELLLQGSYLILGLIYFQILNCNF